MSKSDFVRSVGLMLVAAGLAVNSVHCCMLATRLSALCKAQDLSSQAIVTTNKAFQLHVKDGFVPVQDIVLMRKSELDDIQECLSKLEQEFERHLKRMHGGASRDLVEKEGKNDQAVQKTEE